MRVLMVTAMYPSAERPGWGAFVKAQADAIREQGVEVDVFVIEGYKNWLKYFSAMARLFVLTLRKHYDVIHAHYGLCGIVARIQWWVPVVVSFCGDDLLGHPTRSGRRTPTSRIPVLLHQLLSLCVAKVIVKSQEMKDLVPRKDAVIIPNGVDLRSFRPIPREEAKARLGLAADARYVLFPYDPNLIRKCYPIVVEAVRSLKGEFPTLDLLVAYEKPQEVIPLYMNASDLFVLASYWEGSPNAVKEALACNLPVVSVDVGDVRDLIGWCEGCHICERTAADIAAKTALVLRSGRRIAGRERIAALYSADRDARQIVGIYEAIVGRNSKRLPASESSSSTAKD